MAAEPVKGEAEPVVESGKEASAKPAETEADEQHPDPEKKQRINQRFSDLTKQRDEAKATAEKATAEAKEAREAKAKAEERAAELRAKYEPPKRDDLGPKPERNQFNNEAEHENALVEWAGDKAVREREQKETVARQNRQWNERLAAQKAEMPDYDAVVGPSTLEVSDPVRDAIYESDVGPKILHHLAQNPELVAQLKTLHLGKQYAAEMRLFGKMEAKLEAAKPEAKPAGEKEAPVKPAVAAKEIEVSRASAPISPIRTASVAAETPLVDSKGEFHGTAAQWRAARKAKQIV